MSRILSSYGNSTKNINYSSDLKFGFSGNMSAKNYYYYIVIYIYSNYFVTGLKISIRHIVALAEFCNERVWFIASFIKNLKLKSYNSENTPQVYNHNNSQGAFQKNQHNNVQGTSNQVGVLNFLNNKQTRQTSQSILLKT